MKTLILSTLALLWAWSVTMVQAAVQTHDLTFKHLTTDDGLSQFSVNALYIDENGTLWIGTREGLNSYDGQSITTYKLEKNNPHSLFCNNVRRITGDGNGHLFVLCSEGIASMDLSTGRFTTMLQSNISSFYYHESLYIALRNEIYRYNESTGNFDLYYQLSGNPTPDIFCIEQHNDNLWIGTTNQGVYCLRIDDQSVTHPIPHGNITQIYCDSKNELWIGSWEDGLYRVQAGGRIKNYKANPEKEHALSSNFVRSFCEDNLGNLWIGTFDGLNCYDPVADTFRTYKAGPEEGQLTHASIWSIVKDAQGTLWLGTYFGGVNYFNPEYEIYNRYTQASQPPYGLSNPVVGRMVEDEKGNLWISTEGGGLNYYDRSTKQFRWYRPRSAGNSIAQSNVKALYYDSQRKKVWIGTHLGGLDCLDLATGHFTHHKHVENDRSTIPHNIVRDITPYGTDSLVVATQNGVCLLSMQTGKARQMFKNTREGRSIRMVADVHFDAEGTLWIAATGEGVFSYRFDTDSLKQYKANPAVPGCLSNNNVNNLALDSHGRLWIATSGSGLDLYRPDTDSFENFDKARNGLGSDCIYEVVESPVSGKLLITTNEGFSIFDPDNRHFRNYGIENGFPLTAVNENSLCVTHDGEVFLGSTQGMLSFYETDLSFPPKPYKVRMSRLIVGGREVLPGDDSGILTHTLAYTDEITLNAEQNMFTIEFSTSNYVPANRNDIVYRLEGFSDQWTNTRGTHSITYTNLEPGTYHLVIRPDSEATDPSGQSLYTPAGLTIHILPPFYKTIWAYLLYVLVVGGLLFYFIRTYLMRVKLRESLKYEQKHTEDVEALNQSKLRFFTNISHEFRTPLTLIVAQVETLLQVQQFTPHIYNKVLSIYKNSLQLRELITELLDFRKQDQGHMKIKAAPHDIVSFLYENYLLFKEYAETKQIALDFQHEDETLTLWYDQKQIQKVVNNLLSNAIKHTRPGDHITMGISRIGRYACLQVSDTGEGMEEKEQSKIFDRFYQIEPKDGTSSSGSSGTGIGLALAKGIVELHHGKISVESELGKGTTFIVRLPLDKSAYAEDELATPSEEENQVEQPVGNEATHLLQPDELEETAPLKHLSDAKILIVEDSVPIRNMLADIFTPFYQVLTAGDGEEALQLVHEQMPSIVLSDVVMPRMSGTELCKRIKSDFNTCHIPVVLLTARTNVEQNIEGLRIGADDYITKPFNTTLLISRCNNLVNSRIVLQEKFSHQPQATPQQLATNPIDKDILDRALEVIDRHMDDSEFNVDVFAREMAMARTNLFTKLKAITGQTPNNFILTIRLKRGALMLRNNPELNVSEIADRIGFSSARYFSKCFKEMYQVSPLAYRRGDSEDLPPDDAEE